MTTGADKYGMWNDYRKKVMLPSIEELAKHNFKISHKENVKGRTVVSLDFTVSYEDQATKPAPATRVNKDEPGPLCQVVQEATTRLASPSTQPATEDVTRIKIRLEKLKLTASQISEVLQVINNDSAKIIRFFKETHPLLRDYEAGNKPFDNIAGSTMNLLKTVFPTLYHKEKKG
jgi:hypothetical protein